MEFSFASPNRAVVRTPAKINLYLEVSAPRDDGFHDIDSLFQAVSLFDEIEFEVDADSAQIDLVEEGIADKESNLVYRAAALLREHAGRPREERRRRACLGRQLRVQRQIYNRESS